MISWRCSGVVLVGMTTMVGGPALTQDLRVSEPPSPNYLIALVRRWAADSPLGDLRTGAWPATAVELRLWSGFGLGGVRGLIVRRSSAGVWTAADAIAGACAVTITDSSELAPARLTALRARIRVRCPVDSIKAGWLVRYDSIAVVARESSPTSDALWNELIAGGLEGLPASIPRAWTMLDGHTWVLELRRGQDYRVSVIEAVDQPEHPADVVMQRIVGILRRAYPLRR